MAQKNRIPMQAALLAGASVVGGKEFSGPLGEQFDLHDPSDRFGQKTWEAAESEMQRMAFNLALPPQTRICACSFWQNGFIFSFW